MCDSRHDDDLLGVIDGVDDPVVTDAHAVIVAARELHDAAGAGIDGQRVDGGADSIA